MNRSMNQRQRLSLRAIIVTTDHVFSLCRFSALWKFPNFDHFGLKPFSFDFPFLNNWHVTRPRFQVIYLDFLKSWHFIDQCSPKRSNKRAHPTEREGKNAIDSGNQSGGRTFPTSTCVAFGCIDAVLRNGERPSRDTWSANRCAVDE